MFFSGTPSAITFLYGCVMAELYITEYSGLMKNSFSLLFSLFTMSGYNIKIEQTRILVIITLVTTMIMLL